MNYKNFVLWFGAGRYLLPLNYCSYANGYIIDLIEQLPLALWAPLCNGHNLALEVIYFTIFSDSEANK